MKILLATDGSKHAHAAGKFVGELPWRDPPSATLVHVGEDVEATNVLAAAMQALQTPEMPTSTWSIEQMFCQGHPAQQIVHVAGDSGADLVVMGAQGVSGLAAFFLGSVSEKVARHAPCATLVTRAFGGRTPPRILLALDDSEAAKGLPEALARFKFCAGTQIHVVTVMTVVKLFGMEYLEHVSRPWQQAKAWATAAVTGVAKDLRAAHPGVEVTSHVLEGEDVAMTLVELARELEVTMAVVGSNRKSGLSRLFLGSVSEKFLRHAPCSVWIERFK